MRHIVTLALTALLTQSAAPAAGPWISLFDGKSMDAWRIFKTDRAPAMCATPGAPGNKDCWEIVNGVLQKDGHANDIASKATYGDFELELEWNIGDASNSGVFYRGTEDFNQIYWSAPEYQLLDNVNAADNKKDNHLAGSVYDLFAVPKDAAHSAGQWNQTRIIARGPHVEHWLNGKMVASYDVGSPAWDAAIGASKFSVARYPKFGRATTGVLGIQGDHPGTLALRNIRIRELK
jgi:hypothetical protein